ncbi:MAG: ATP-binding protein [Omnitrophica WOR_2 bacterium]
MDEITQITQTIAALEAQRDLLGDAVIDTALAPLRNKLASLQLQPAVEQRKLVTVLFADLVGFTAISSGMDPEEMREIVNAYFKLWAVSLEHYGGVVEKYIGDAVMAVFGLAVSKEDDPESAIRAALEMRQSLSGLNQELEARWGIRLVMRVGIHTGPVMVSFLGERKGQDFVVVGDTVNLASRIQGIAPAGGILISHDTYRHIRGVFDVETLEPVNVKGKVGSIQIYLVLQAKQRAFRMPARGVEGIETSMIGRDRELQRLKEFLEQMIQAHQIRLVTVTGEAGIGKTRLVTEFDQWIERLPQVLCYFKGRSSQAMQNLPYSLLRDLFSFRFHIQDSDPPHVLQEKIEQGIGEFESEDTREESQLRAHFIAHLLGFKFENSTYLHDKVDDPRLLHDRALAYLIEYFSRLSAVLPVVLLLEDIHWADDSSLNILENLVEKLSNQSFLVVCTTRPTIYERKPGWGKGQREGDYAHIDLKPLSRRDNRRLVNEILKKVEKLPSNLRALIVDRSEGNPFFTEELIKMLIEDGVILKEGDRWQVDLGKLANIKVPPTLVEVLQSRFDSLGLEERVLLQRASVLGRIFWDGAVSSMERNDEDHVSLGPRIGEFLNQLSAREMIFPSGSSAFEDVHEYHFKHALLRDVTYESALKRLRRVYHAYAATWLEAVTMRSRRSDEYAALIAGHYDLAEEWSSARDWYLKAGILAADHYANAEGIRCFTRCLELWSSEDPAGKADIILRRIKLYDVIANRVAQKNDLEALQVLAEGLDESKVAPAVDQNKTTGLWRARALLQWWHFYDGLGEFQAGISVAEQAAALSRGAGDLEIEALAYLFWGASAWRLSDFSTARTKLEPALGLSRQAGLSGLEADILRNLGIVLEYQGEYARARDNYESALKMYKKAGNERGESMTLNSLGSLLVDQGLYRQAHPYFMRSLALKRKIGHRRAEHITLHNLGVVASRLGQYVEARQYLEQVLRFYSEVGDRDGEADALHDLGMVWMHLGDFQQAQVQLDQSKTIYHEAGAKAGEFQVLISLALLALYQGKPKAAHLYSQKALTLGKEISLPREQIHLNLITGRLLLDIGRVQQAQEVLSKTQDASQELGHSGSILQSRAELARAFQASGHVDQALQEIEQVLENLDLENGPNFAEANREILESMDEPFWVLLSCYQTLEAAGDSRAVPLLDATYRYLNKRAEMLVDESRRNTFLAIPIHQEIIASWQKLYRN